MSEIPWFLGFVHHIVMTIMRKRNYDGNNEAVWLISFFRCYNSSFSFTTNINSRLHFLFYPFFQISEASIIIGIWLHIHIILVKKEWRGFSISKKWTFGGVFSYTFICDGRGFFFFHIFSLFLPKVKYNPKMLSFFF